jgi:hypothetical protein
VFQSDQYVIEVNDLPYDRQQLVDIFEQAKPFARIKGLGWRNYEQIKLPPVEQSAAVVIYSGDYMNLDPNRHLNYNFLNHKYIKEMVQRLRFDHPITPNNIDMVWYRPGFEFEPHIDHYALSTMMWPVLPEDGGAPIDFYYNSDIDLQPLIKARKPAGFKNQVSQEHIIETHYYSTSVPTIFNSVWIHGVRPVAQERIYLRLRINERFESLVSKIKNKTLVR